MKKNIFLFSTLIFGIIVLPFLFYTQIKFPDKEEAKTQQAVKKCNDDIKIYPKNSFAYFHRARLKIELKDYKGAERDLNSVLLINSDMLSLYLNKTKYTLIKNLNNENNFNKFTFVKPSYNQVYSFYSQIYKTKGLIKYELKDYDSALIDLNKAIRLNPLYIEVYRYRGVVKNDLGDYSGALDDFNKALAVEPDYVQAIKNRGISKYHLGDYSGAMMDLNTAINLKPTYAQAYKYRAYIKSLSGDKKGALEDLKESKKIFIKRGNEYKPELKLIEKEIEKLNYTVSQ